MARIHFECGLAEPVCGGNYLFDSGRVMELGAPSTFLFALGGSLSGYF